MKLQDEKQANAIKDLAKTSQVEHIKGYLPFLFPKSCFFCLLFLTAAELPKIGGKGDDWTTQLTAILSLFLLIFLQITTSFSHLKTL